MKRAVVVLDETLEKTAAELNDRLIDALTRRKALTDDRIAAAMRAAPRHHFLDSFSASIGDFDLREREGIARALEAAYADDALMLSWGHRGRGLASISQPTVVVEMLQALAIEEAHRVLEVGAGSGWNAALIAELVGEEGRVVTVEVSEQLAESARERLIPWNQVVVLHADGRFGAPEEGPFDRIMVTAGTRKIYDAWMSQLRTGGILVTPTDAGMDFSPMLRIVKREDGLEVKQLSYARFVPVRAGKGRLPDPPGTPVEKLMQRI